MASLVAPEFHPTLADELAPAPRAVKIALAVLVGLIVLAVLAELVHRKEEDTGGARVVRASPVAFNMRYTGSLHVAQPASGELLRLEGNSIGGARPDSFVVQPLQLPAYTGNVTGILPIAGSQELTQLHAQFPSMELVQEGKARVNDVIAYTIVFRASRSPRLYGRVILLPEPAPGARAGVKLVMLSAPHAGGGADVASDVGSEGALKTPYRSFRFGTEGP